MGNSLFTSAASVMSREDNCLVVRTERIRFDQIADHFNYESLD